MCKPCATVETSRSQGSFESEAVWVLKAGWLHRHKYENTPKQKKLKHNSHPSVDSVEWKYVNNMTKIRATTDGKNMLTYANIFWRAWLRSSPCSILNTSHWGPGGVVMDLHWATPGMAFTHHWGLVETVTASNSFAGPPSNAIACERKVDLADGQLQRLKLYIWTYTRYAHT